MKKVLGFSGGFDSAVSAYLLKKLQYEVIGVSILTYDSEHQRNEMKKAKRIADVFCIEHIIVDATKQFNNIVIKYFLNNYETGRTPNPCAL